MEALVIIYITLLGMVAGSFLGLAVVRVPLGESLISPRSHCRHCDHVLSWYENIPILSYLFLRGKCRGCHQRISPLYFFIELVTTGTVLFAYFQIQPWPRFLLYLFTFILPMLFLLFLDWRELILPDQVTLPGIAAGFVVHWVDGRFLLPYQFDSSTFSLLRESLLGAIAGSLTLFVIAVLYQRLRKQPGLGGGDVKLAGMIGAFFGWQSIFFIFFLASMAGIVFGLVMIFTKRATKETPIPFGSFLAGVALVFLFWGPYLLRAYLSWVRNLF